MNLMDRFVAKYINKRGPEFQGFGLGCNPVKQAANVWPLQGRETENITVCLEKVVCQCIGNSIDNACRLAASVNQDVLSDVVRAFDQGICSARIGAGCVIGKALAVKGYAFADNGFSG